MRKVIRFFRELYRKTHKLIYWFPIIWNDRWWDSYFLLRIVEHKLRYDAEQYVKYGIACGCDRRAKQMRIVANLCKRLVEDDYTTPWDEEDKEHSRQFEEYLFAAKKHKKNGIVYYSSEGFVAEKQLEKASMLARKHRDYMTQQDLDYFCRMIRKHLWCWWD